MVDASLSHTLHIDEVDLRAAVVAAVAAALEAHLTHWSLTTTLECIC
jgi:hypothetical protein